MSGAAAMIGSGAPEQVCRNGDTEEEMVFGELGSIIRND